MGSSGHRANILRSSYNRVGIGVVHSGGKIWVTVRFLAGPAISGTTGLGPPPPPPGVRTALTGDFDGDGHDDLLTYNPGTTGRRALVRPRRPRACDKVAVSGERSVPAGRRRLRRRRPHADPLVRTRAPRPTTCGSGTGAAGRPRSSTVNGTYKPLVGDFDGDGRDDLLWYAAGGGGDYYWYGNRNGTFTSVAATINGTYAPLIGDLDGNGGDDLFWYAKGTTPDFIWYSTLHRGGYSSRSTTVNGTLHALHGRLRRPRHRRHLLVRARLPRRLRLVHQPDATAGTPRCARTVTDSYLPAAADFDGNGADDVVWFSPTQRVAATRSGSAPPARPATPRRRPLRPDRLTPPRRRASDPSRAPTRVDGDEDAAGRPAPSRRRSPGRASRRRPRRPPPARRPRRGPGRARSRRPTRARRPRPPRAAPADGSSERATAHVAAPMASHAGT